MGDDGQDHYVIPQRPGEACTSDDAEAHAEQYLLDAKNRASGPVVSDLDEPPLVRAVRRAFAEADAAGNSRPGRPALVTLTGATEHQVRVAMETVAASEPEPGPAESTLVTVGDGVSPFESIRRVRSDGSEYWSARELVPLMGYSRWEYFETPVQRAMASAANVGMDVASHFLRSQEMVERRQGGGPNRNDYELSREAAYLVAMNGDPSEPGTGLRHRRRHGGRQLHLRTHGLHHEVALSRRDLRLVREAEAVGYVRGTRGL